MNRMINLPIEIEHDSEYKSKLHETFENYYKWISGEFIKNLHTACKFSKLDPSLFNAESFASEINEIEHRIENILESYYSARISKAIEEMRKLLKKLIEEDTLKFVVSDIDKSYATRLTAPFPALHAPYLSNPNEYYCKMQNEPLSFFRARVGEVSTPAEMSHIPFNKRDIIATQRFSVPGTPCLYMGTSSYDIWKELGQPPLSKFNVSAIRLKAEKDRVQIKILNLINDISLQEGLMALPHDSPHSHDSICLAALLAKMWPLVCATSFRVKNSRGNFHSEYIISHLIMLCLPLLEIDGIAYTSKRIKANDRIHALPLFVNIAIPMISSSVENTLGNLCSSFEITAPVNFQEILSLNLVRSAETQNNCFFAKAFPESSANKYLKDISFANKSHYYRDTAFFSMDNYLCGLNFSPMSTEQNNF